MNLPTTKELQTLRKDLRKRKLPRVFDGMWCSEPGIGGMKLTASEGDLQVEWVSFEGDVKSALKHAAWSKLCTDRALEMERLEIGYVVSEILLAQAQKVQDSIGHPIAAINETKPYRDAAEEWIHWATVEAGHMLGL